MIRLTAAIAALVFATPIASHALSKRTDLFRPDRADDWSAGASCITRYYNVCTGWIWVWSGFGDERRFGVVSEGCCSSSGSSSLLLSTIYVETSVPSGRGFTGTISTYAADASNCPAGPPIATQPFLPTSIFHLTPWGGLVVPNPFVVAVTIQEPFASPATFGSDHPAAGPTGSDACGVCYPAERVTHSFLYGTTGAPLCPGEPFDDGICHAELIWDFTFACATPVEESSWGKLKTLYK